jgi:hypothetical protein
LQEIVNLLGENVAGLIREKSRNYGLAVFKIDSDSSLGFYPVFS